MGPTLSALGDVHARPFVGVFQSQFLPGFSSFDKNSQQNGSKNGETAPRPATGYPHEGPSVAGWQTVLKLTCWVREPSMSTHPSTLEPGLTKSVCPNRLGQIWMTAQVLLGHAQSWDLQLSGTKVYEPSAIWCGWSLRKRLDRGGRETDGKGRPGRAQVLLGHALDTDECMPEAGPSRHGLHPLLG